MRTLIIAAIFAVALPSPSIAQGPNPRTNVELRGVVRPNPGSFGDVRRRTGDFANWKLESDAALMSYNYRNALRFAECVAGLDPAAADRILKVPIGGRDDDRQLRWLAQGHGACVLHLERVHPLLLRAALAETALRSKRRGLHGTGAPVGVPDEVDGYPLGLVSRCQVALAPMLVTGVLAAQPGSRQERAAAELLFARTSCGASRLGRLSPTAARLALVEASYRSVQP
jgi:hypothetical protein